MAVVLADVAASLLVQEFNTEFNAARDDGEVAGLDVENAALGGDAQAALLGEDEKFALSAELLHEYWKHIAGIDGADPKTESKAKPPDWDKRLERQLEVRWPQMPLTDVLIFKRGIPAVRATKLLYYKMAEFAGRLLPPPKIAPASGEALPPVAWNDRVPIAAGAPLSGATTPHLTEGQLDGLEELPLDALHFDPDVDPFAAIERGDDPEEATRRWMMASINGVDDGRALA